MSVTSPTLKVPPEALAELEADDPPLLALELLLLLPHATSTRASAAALSAARLERLILPFNEVSSHIYGTKLQPYPLSGTLCEAPNTP
jgi:hypothetical protein